MIILKNATVFNSIETKLFPGSTVVIRGDRIEAVGRDVIAPSNADVILDLKGKTALPGFIDAHVHFGGADGFDHPGIGSKQETYDYLKSRMDALKWGITTVRSTGDYMPDILEFRDEVNLGQHISPRIIAAGKMIQARGGHPVSTVFGGNAAIAEGACVLVDENTDLDKEVKALADAGVDWIKAFISEVNKLDYPARVPRIPPEMIKRIVDLAHFCGKPCTIHVDNISHMREAAMAGADCIEHVFSVGASDTEIDDDLIELLIKNRTYIVPTVFSIKAHENPEGNMPLVYEKLIRQVGKLIAAGVNIGAGTDSNIPFVTLGESFHEELSELVKCGMAPLEALKAATNGNAKLLRKDDEIGAILPGYYADMIVVGGDPIKDINQTKNIDLVIANGRIMM